MIKFINERELAEGLLNDKKLINDNTITRIRCYIKLLKQKGMSKTDIRNEIDNLMLEHYSGFVMGDWDDTTIFVKWLISILKLRIVSLEKW